MKNQISKSDIQRHIKRANGEESLKALIGEENIKYSTHWAKRGNDYFIISEKGIEHLCQTGHKGEVYDGPHKIEDGLWIGISRKYNWKGKLVSESKHSY